MPTHVLVSGASGFVGSHLTRALLDRGHPVRAMTRRPADYTGAGVPVFGDVRRPRSLHAAMQGVEVAYYLVHSLERADFEDRDAEAAVDFGAAAAAAGVQRIVYLGGLGRDGDLSAHLRSRREVEQLLGLAGVPVTTLRAAVVVGDGSISWELTRRLSVLLPLLVAPGALHTRTQPIALHDVVRYLVGVLDAPAALGRTFEIGGPEVLRYSDMLHRAARGQDRRLVTMGLPLPLPGFAPDLLALVTGVDAVTARNLLGSMTTEVVVRDRAIDQVVPGAPIGYDEAVRQALAARAERLGGTGRVPAQLS